MANALTAIAARDKSDAAPGRDIEDAGIRSQTQGPPQTLGELRSARVQRVADQHPDGVVVVGRRAALLEGCQARVWVAHRERLSTKSKTMGFGSKGRPSFRARRRSGSLALSCARACSR